MRISLGQFVSSLLCFTGLILAAPILNAQQKASAPAQQQVATVVNSSTSKVTSSVPVFTAYRGITIGMTNKEVRSKLEGLKKGDRQDFLVSSEGESAQIYYNESGLVTAVSVDYFGDNGNAPSPEAVLGGAIEAKADGSMYQLKRYPEAGYWVSYNRTAGDKPIVTVTIQKI